MTGCRLDGAATVELLFYGELSAFERAAMESHIAGCVACRRTLEELAVIRAALDARPDVSSPPRGDWSGFMARLDAAARADAGPTAASPAPARLEPRRRAAIGVLMAAALLALVTVSIALVLRDGRTSPQQSGSTASAVGVPVSSGVEPAVSDAALAEVSEAHFERSKLVVLGLLTRDAAGSTADDWSYERSLASSLLNDTRLYRQSAEERGMKALAGVMRDLELVLLQTAMSEKPDADSLGQLQRLIRRRNLITKMDVVATTGLLP
jgi:anti-sigma factor RsiW